mgnify:CR=1 FL=1
MTKEELQLLIKTHDRSKSNTIRLDKLESRVEDIYELTVSVKEIATEIKAMREDMNKIDNRLIAVESKPAKRWEGIVDKIIFTIIGILISFIFLKIGIGG